MHNTGFLPCDILLPAASCDLTAWACVACDQYTSQPEYWAEAAALAGDKPSCLRLTLPECFLPQSEQRIPRIHQAMAKYLEDGTLIPAVRDGYVLLERTTENGARLGLVGAVDLESYDYTGVPSIVRPTEETITARLPARLAIRRGASLETSHIMLLLDDPLKRIIEPLYARRESLPLLYDFPLMQGGGHLRGWAIAADEDKAAIQAALLAHKATLGENPLLFAVGDGNHSLATAKARWEEIKPTLTPAEQAVHPARFALAEAVNLHDPALYFEPIHRVLTGVNPQSLLADWADYCANRGMTLVLDGPAEGAQVFPCYFGEEEHTAAVLHPNGPLAVATLQTYLDDFLARHDEAEIDYIHGDDVLRRLSRAPGAMGFLLPPLDKFAFFPAVEKLRILPRKTFSMGHAHEKRYYMECRAFR